VKVLTVLGTRPEIIRLSPLIELLDGLCDHVLVHTGQNSDPTLSDVFFEQLGVRSPNTYLGISGGTFADRIGAIISGVGEVLTEERPDRLLVLGDTDSGLSAFVAKRLGIPVFHMEAGNRCFDDRVPEEVNRRVIDHSSDILMPYTERSRANLIAEGIQSQRIYVTGNPIKEVMDRHANAIEASDALDRLGVDADGYLLLTAHRQETVDLEERLSSLVVGVTAIARDLGLPLVCSIHPRTKAKLESFGVELEGDGVIASPPLGFFDFLKLERHARCVLTDSGTVQEECCILGVPAVTVRDTTERPETVECGSNMIAGVEREGIRRCVLTTLATFPRWVPPREYMVEAVSPTVARIVLGAAARGSIRSGSMNDAGQPAETG